MSELPYTYTDVDGVAFRVGPRVCTAYDRPGRASVGFYTPTGEDAVAVARAVLAAAGDTVYRVVSVGDMSEDRLAAMRIGAEAMQERAAQQLEHTPPNDSPPEHAALKAAYADNIRALPLLPDDDTPTQEQNAWARLKSEIPRLLGRERVEDLPHDSEYATALHDVLVTMKRIENNSPLLADGETVPDQPAWPVDGDDLGCGDHCPCDQPTTRDSVTAEEHDRLINVAYQRGYDAGWGYGSRAMRKAAARVAYEAAGPDVQIRVHNTPLPVRPGEGQDTAPARSDYDHGFSDGLAMGHQSPPATGDSDLIQQVRALVKRYGAPVIAAEAARQAQRT